MKNKVDRIINKYMEKGYFPSAVCKIFSPEEIYYQGAFGPAKLDTVYDVASLTKIVTSTEVLMLINEGKLSLNGQVSRYLPIVNDYDILRERLKGVTIEQLLTHNSGLIAWYPFYSEKGTVFEIMNKALSGNEKFEGTLYSDLNFILLAEVIKSVTGLSLEESLDKYIKERLNLKNIFYCPKDKTNIAPTSFGNGHEENMVKEGNIELVHWKSRDWRGHDKAIVGEVHDGNAYYYFNGVAGHAGLFADVDAYVDLCRYYMLSTDELMNSSRREHREGRGLGWQISEAFPSGCGHTGFTGTSIYISEDKSIGAVTFTNRVHTKEEGKDLFNFRKELHTCVLDYKQG